VAFRALVREVAPPRHVLGVAPRDGGELGRAAQRGEVVLGAHLVHAREQLRLRAFERLERRGGEPDHGGEAGAEPEPCADAPHFWPSLSHFWNTSAELASRLTSFPFW